MSVSARHDWWRSVTNAARTYRHRAGRTDLPPRVAQEVEAVEEALELYPTGDPRRRVVELHLRGDSLTAAAMDTGYSVDHAYQINRLYLYELARLLGYE